MSTALQTIQERIAAQLAVQRQSVAQPGGNNISVKGKVFTMPDGSSNNGPLQAIILDHRNVNTHYSGAYNPQQITPPDCFAIGTVIETMGPGDDVEKPHGKVCQDCAKNEWGSGNGKGKACQNTVRIAIVPPDADAEAEPMTIKISPSGLASWNKLNADLITAELLPIQIVVDISFDPNVTYPKLQFKAAEPHDNVELFWALREKAQSLLDRTFAD
jgi:hypothetical protein